MSGRGGGAQDDPMGVVNRAMADFEGDEGGATAPFIPSPSFAGAKPGYYFGHGVHGTGYYVDLHAAGTAPAGPSGAGAGPSSRAARPPPRTAAELLEEAEEAAGDAAMQVVDSKALRRLITNLERRYNANIEARTKFAGEPQRFLESEIELDEAVRGMAAAAASPELYPELVAAGAVPTLIALLHHENSDIAAAGIEILSELTDADAVEDSEAEAGVLVDALLEGGLLEALAGRLRSLNEAVPEEAAGVYNALSVLENAVELRSEVAEKAAEHKGLLEWLLQRVRPKATTDGNKQYAAEVLAVVLQAGGEPARRRFVALDGVEAVLRAVAPYKTRDPDTAEESEFVENAYDVLCAVLMEKAAKEAFVEAAGAELMAITLKGRTAARAGALKCLDFATTRCPAACDQLVDFGGLGTVFALFMGRLKPKGAAKKRRDESTAAEEEERCVSIIANLITECTGDARKARVGAKFAENEFEKCDRLMEMYDSYDARVAAGESALAAELGEGEEVEEDELLVARLDAGLFTLQAAAVVAAELWALGDAGVRRRLLALLHQRGRTLAALRAVLLERRATLAAAAAGAEGDEAQEARRQVERTSQLLAALGHKEEEVEEEGEKEEDEKGGGGKRRREEEEEEGAPADGGAERSTRLKT